MFSTTDKSDLLGDGCIFLKEMIIVYNRDSKIWYFTHFIDIAEATHG